MEDIATTTIRMSPDRFKEYYIPTPDDFDSLYPEERIREIADAFKRGISAAKQRVHLESQAFEEYTEEWENVESKPSERTISMPWVCRYAYWYTSKTTNRV